MVTLKRTRIITILAFSVAALIGMQTLASACPEGARNGVVVSSSERFQKVLGPEGAFGRERPSGVCPEGARNGVVVSSSERFQKVLGPEGAFGRKRPSG